MSDLQHWNTAYDLAHDPSWEATYMAHRLDGKYPDRLYWEAKFVRNSDDRRVALIYYERKPITSPVLTRKRHVVPGSTPVELVLIDENDG